MDNIKLDNFEGPLDLLLHLVKESNIDICDIKIEEITDKYLDYINREDNINISSSYLVLAAELMYLKSKSLLPSIKTEEEDEEEITREKLINKLLEYEKYKELTKKFKLLEEERQKIYIKSPEKITINNSELVKEATVTDLLEAFRNFLERQRDDKPIETAIANREYSVKERKIGIKNILKLKKKASLEELFEEYSRPYMVVTFLSILEMVKEKELLITQDKNFEQIFVELRN